ncbi:MAG: hypothetical protein KFW09_01860 [Oscillospiraceae bacterium]|nr:hypothetical protein [Oscillospiraceae bacterium]
MNTIIIKNQEVLLKKLSSEETVKAIHLSKDIMDSLSHFNVSTDILSAISENLSIALSSCYILNKPFFSSWQDAFSSLSVDELCLIFETYDRLYFSDIDLNPYLDYSSSNKTHYLTPTNSNPLLPTSHFPQTKSYIDDFNNPNSCFSNQKTLNSLRYHNNINL